jgi:hypothetical protein
MNIIQSPDYTLTFFGGIDHDETLDSIDPEGIVFNNDVIMSFDGRDKHKKKGGAESDEFIKKHWNMFDDLGFTLNKIVEVNTDNQIAARKTQKRKGANDNLILATRAAIISAAHEDPRDDDETDDDDDLANYLGGQEDYINDLSNEYVDDFVKTQTDTYTGSHDDEYDFYGSSSDAGDDDEYNFYE